MDLGAVVIASARVAPLATNTNGVEIAAREMVLQYGAAYIQWPLSVLTVSMAASLRSRV